MAQHRHKRDTNARTGLTTLFRPQERPTPGKRALARPTRRPARIVAPLALLATASAVTLGLVSGDETSGERPLAGSGITPSVDVAERDATVSRSGSRSAEASASAAAAKAAEAAKAAKAAKAKAARAETTAEAAAEARVLKEREKAARAKAATAAAVKAADTAMWAETDLNLWSGPAASAKKVGLLEEGDKVLVTGRKAEGRTEVVVAGRSRWVTSGHLSAEKPSASASGVGGTCSNGSSVPAGLDASIAEIHRAVCARWPAITDYGTTRNDGEHAQGRAIDIMVSGATGWEIADYLRANASALGIEYLIYAQKIWSVERGAEGWRAMSDRGSATANHYDHVHVTVW